jgi:hypothetical protein
MKHSFFVLLLGCLIITGCNGDKKHSQSLQTDIRNDRFEVDLFTADPSDLERNISYWNQKYGEFFSHFCQVTGIGDTSVAGFGERLQAFATDKNNYRLYKKTIEVFPDLSALTLNLNKAFSNYLHYFPHKKVPHICTFISALSRSAITDDSLLAIGLDRYLGSMEPLYRAAGIYNYIAADMYPERIPSDCMSFWAETEFPFNDSVNNLISNMIYQGRILYFTRTILEYYPDTLNLGFSSDEIEYLKKNESSMWTFLIEHKLLFNTDRFTINKFILEGPFTTDFGRNSPARAAVWIGYRITEAYVNRKKDGGLSSLMNETDYLRILNESGYNPR